MAEFASGRRGARRRSDHRRRRRRGAPAGHGRGAYDRAGAGRARSERRAAGARFAAVDRADARRRAGRDARHRQGRRHQRGTPRRLDSVQLASGAAARSSARFATSRPRKSGRNVCREPVFATGLGGQGTWSRRARRSACSAADSSDACSRSRPAGWGTASIRSRPTTTRPPVRSPTSRSPPPTRTSTRSARSRVASRW